MIEDEARAFVEGVEAELRPLSTAVSLAHWEASTTGHADAIRRATDAEARLRKFLGCRSRFDTIVRFQRSSGVRDPKLRRQLRLLELEHRANLLPAAVIDDLVRRSNEIQAEFYTYRARLDGREVTNNELLDILRHERDSGRRQAAWEASKQIAARIAGRLLELVRRRNESAQSLGYRDYYAMQLELSEIDEAELFDILDELKRQTDGPFAVAKADIDRRLADRYGARVDELRPWHYEDPFFQETPLAEELGLDHYFQDTDPVRIVAEFFNSIGLPIQDVLNRSDLYERQGKDQHAYCTDIDREGDVRILCNVKPDSRWTGILLHELGHAAYDKFLPRSLPWILRQPAHIAATEGVAMFMDRLIYDIDWLEGAAGIRASDRNQLGSRSAEARRFEHLLTARWVIVMTRFERALYADPDRSDLDSFWWELVGELQHVRKPEGRRAPDWAAKIHLTVAPVYYHNYLLGELIASQLGAAFRGQNADAETRGYVGQATLGSYLRERVFRHGASLDWQELLESATGARLSADAFLQEFVLRAEA